MGQLRLQVQLGRCGWPVDLTRVGGLQLLSHEAGRAVGGDAVSDLRGHGLRGSAAVRNGDQ